MNVKEANKLLHEYMTSVGDLGYSRIDGRDQVILDGAYTRQDLRKVLELMEQLPEENVV